MKRKLSFQLALIRTYRQSDQTLFRTAFIGDGMMPKGSLYDLLRNGQDLPWMIRYQLLFLTPFQDYAIYMNTSLSFSPGFKKLKYFIMIIACEENWPTLAMAKSNTKAAVNPQSLKVKWVRYCGWPQSCLLTSRK